MHAMTLLCRMWLASAELQDESGRRFAEQRELELRIYQREREREELEREERERERMRYEREREQRAYDRR
jgi:hypothetical protein